MSRTGDTWAPIEERLWRRVAKTATCWLWLGAADTYGHGKIGEWADGRQRMRRPYRIAWELAHGPIPDGHELHHQCRQPRCVRPTHLQLLTHAEHRAIHALEQAVDECRHGHSYDSANTRRRANGKKVCRECDKQRQRRNRARRRTTSA
jgi:hypothetical protein